ACAWPSVRRSVGKTANPPTARLGFFQLLPTKAARCTAANPPTVRLGFFQSPACHKRPPLTPAQIPPPWVETFQFSAPKSALSALNSTMPIIGASRSHLRATISWWTETERSPTLRLGYLPTSSRSLT